MEENILLIKEMEVVLMERKISVEFGRLFMVLLRKIWVFALVMLVFVCGGLFRASIFNNEIVTYSVTGKLLISQQSGEKVGEMLDNASRVQASYDAVEVLKSGNFLKRVCNELPFEMTVSELKGSIELEQVPSTRVLNINISGSSAEKVEDILTVTAKSAQNYLAEIMPEVKVVSLEDADTISIVQNQSSVNGLKIGVLMGMAVCVLIAFAFVVLYLMNDSIRYREEAQEFLGIKVIGVVEDKK